MTEHLKEQDRLRALRAFNILQTEPETAFDRVAGLASRLLHAPIGLVTFVDGQGVWCKARVGFDQAWVARADSFCSIAITEPGVMVVPDASKDARFAAKTLVAGSLGIRFYAGAPIVTPDGFRLGVVCALDTEPRPGLTEDERAALADLAAIVADQLDLRRRTAALAALQRERRQAARVLARITRLATCEEALAAVLAELCIFHGAYGGRIWKVTSPGPILRQLSRFDAAPNGPRPADSMPHSLAPQNSLAARLIISGEAGFFSTDETGPAAHPPGPLDVEYRAACGIIQPVSVGDQSFGITLAFDSPRSDIAEIAASVALLADTIAPVLDRKAAESRLRLLGKALDAASDSVLITEAEPLGKPGLRIVYVNDGFTRMTGYSLADVQGRSPRLLQGADTDPAASERLGTSLRQGRPSRTELLNYRKDGAPFWVELDITPVVDEYGTLTNWIAIQRDITSRKNNETERKFQDEYFRILFEKNPLSMFVYDVDSSAIIEVNEAALVTYGCSRETFLRRDIASLARDGNGASLPEGLGTPGSGFAPSIWSYTRNGGSVRRARAAAHEMIFAGRRRRLVALWDITEIEQARVALRQSHDALQAAATALQARTAELTEVNRRAKLGMWRFPAADGAPSWSDEIFEVFGRAAQVPAPSWTTAIGWVHADDRAAVQNAFHVAAATQTKQTFEFRAVRPDGRVRYCLADLHPEFAPDGRLAALKGFCQDVTERKETELTLLHSEKLRAIGQLTGGVAHDFNNLLTVTVLSLEEAIETLPAGDPLLELLEPALHASMRGYELTSQLLSYSRSSQLEPTRIDLAAFFGRLLPLLRRSLGDRYSVDVRHGVNVGDPFGDVAKLESAVMNLVINARDAMPSGGVIVIETSLVSLTATSAGFLDEVTPGHYIVISVSDTGCGIPASVLPRIFEPFFTTKPVGKGSGLGLSMMYGFVKQSGGHVTASSEVGVGTAVRIYLPTAPRSG
ncbi:MAG: PAS domain S-box protein [Acetobacteraceae bacterium]